jgi:transposase
VKKFIRIGIDLAKNYFQVHALMSESAPAVTRKLTRSKMHEFFAQIEPCLIGMEACGSAHYWARELKAMGHKVLLMPPAYTKPYVKRGKNDAVDADAICEAVSRPGMRFVPIKSTEQQATLMLHRTRELLVKQRTMSVNALRSHLSEFGIIAPKGIGRVDELRFCRVARSHAAPEFQRRQANARGHHQGRKPIHKETARLGGDLAAERRGQAQRRFARLDRRAARKEAGTAGHGGTG